MDELPGSEYNTTYGSQFQGGFRDKILSDLSAILRQPVEEVSESSGHLDGRLLEGTHEEHEEQRVEQAERLFQSQQIPVRKSPRHWVRHFSFIHSPNSNFYLCLLII